MFKTVLKNNYKRVCFKHHFFFLKSRLSFSPQQRETIRSHFALTTVT